MKYLIALMVAILLLCSLASFAETVTTQVTVPVTLDVSVKAVATPVPTPAVVPPKPKSVGFTFGPDGIQVIYLNDGKNYGLAFGGEVYRQGRLSVKALIAIEPTNNAQFGLGPYLGYDIPWKKLTITPLYGLNIPITAGANGNRSLRGMLGVAATIKFK